MNEKTNSTKNLLDFTDNCGEVDNDSDKLCANSGLNFQMLAKRVTGKRLNLKDCYLMVSAALQKVRITKTVQLVHLVGFHFLLAYVTPTIISYDRIKNLSAN